MRLLSICLAALLTFSSSQLQAEQSQTQQSQSNRNCYREGKENRAAQIYLTSSNRKVEGLIKKKKKYDEALPEKIKLLTDKTIRLQRQVVTTAAKTGLNCATERCSISKALALRRLEMRIAQNESKKIALTQKSVDLGAEINAATEKASSAEKNAEEKAKALTDCEGTGSSSSEQQDQ